MLCANGFLDFMESYSSAQNLPTADEFMVDDVCDDDATEGDIPDDHGSDHGFLASTVSDHSTIDAQDFMNDDDHHGDDIDNDNGFMDGLPHGETDPDGPMGGAGASEPTDEAVVLQAASCVTAITVPSSPPPVDTSTQAQRKKGKCRGRANKNRPGNQRNSKTPE